jgi:Flp pilus assembly protein TadG
MNLTTFSRILVNKHRFARAQEGIAVLEFALIMPVLIALFFGAVELTREIIISQKVEKVAVTVSDVVAQSSTVTTADLNQTLVAAEQLMLPYSFGASGYVIVTSVTKTGSNQPTVNWQYTGGGTWTKASKIGSTGGTASLPAGFTLNSGENIIVAEVFYNYAPMLSGLVLSASTIYKLSIYKPRLGDLMTLG